MHIPAAVSVFPDEIYTPPQSWAEEAYPKLIHFNELDKGGHFAAWEQPELFGGGPYGLPVAPLGGRVARFARLQMPSLGGTTGWLDSSRPAPPGCGVRSS